MKKFSALFIAILLAASFTACQNSSAKPNETSSVSVEASDVSASASNQESDGNALRSLKIGNTTGRYGTAFQMDHTILCYIDYPSASDTALCAQPACNHDSESCTAYIANGYTVSSIAIVDDQTIAFLVNPLSSENGGAIIYLADSNGSNRRKIFQADSGEDIWELCCADDENLYFSVFVTQPDGSGDRMDLYRVPLDGGDAEQVFPLADQVLGVDGREIVCYEYNFEVPENTQEPEIPEGATQEEIDQLYVQYQSSFVGTHRVYLQNVDTGAERDLETWTSPMGNEGRLQMWQDGALYWCDSQWNQLPDQLHWTSENGQSSEIAVSWPSDVLTDVQNDPEGNAGVERLETIVENRALLTVKGPWEEFRRYAVDLSDGSVTEIPLRYQSNGKEKPVAILGQSADSLLVEIETQMEEVTYIQSDGTPTTNGSVINRYALISFVDFFAGNPNYREIQTQYLQSLW